MNQPTESPAEIAERLLPCMATGACGVKPLVGGVPRHFEPCPALYRPAIAAALQAERERADQVIHEEREITRQFAIEFEGINKETDLELSERANRIAELELQLAAERERALEEAAILAESWAHRKPVYQLPEAIRALAQKGGGDGN